MELPPGQFAYAGIQPDGKIVLAGGGGTFDEDGDPLSTSFELARFNNTGLQIVSAIHFDPAIIGVGVSLNVRLSGSNLTDQTYFDVRFRSPGSTTNQVALNWQQGTSARHTIPGDTPRQGRGSLQGSGRTRASANTVASSFPFPQGSM